MRAEVNLRLGETDCILIYDWDAIAELEKKFTIDKMADVISKASIAQLADILECGLKRNNPEIKAEDIFNLSPPIVEVRQAVDLALTLAYFGTDNPDEVAKNIGGKKKKKKGIKLLILLSLLFTLGYLLMNFGN